MSMPTKGKHHQLSHQQHHPSQQHQQQQQQAKQSQHHNPSPHHHQHIVNLNVNQSGVQHSAQSYNAVVAANTLRFVTNSGTEFHASSQNYGSQPGAQVGGGGGSVGLPGGRPPPLGNIQTLGQSTTVISTGGPNGGQQVTLQASTQRVQTQQPQGPSAAAPPVHTPSPQEMGKQGHLQTQPSQLSQAYVTTQPRPAVSQGYFQPSRPQHPRGPSHRGAHGGSGSQVLSMPIGGGGQPTMYPQQMTVQSPVFLSNHMSTIHPNPHQQSVNPWGNPMSLQPYGTGAPQRTQAHQASYYPFPQHSIIPAAPYPYASSASHQNYFYSPQINLRNNANTVSGAMQHVGGPLAGAQGAAVVSQGTLQPSTQQSQYIPSSITIQLPHPPESYSGHNGGAANLVNSGNKNKKVKRPHALDIVDPDTHACVDVFSDDESTQSSDSSNRETPRPQNGSAEVIIATFAAQVAKAATEGSDSNSIVSSCASEASSVSHNVIQNIGNVQINSNNEIVNDSSGSSTPIPNEVVSNESLTTTTATVSISPTPEHVAPSIDFPVTVADVQPSKEFQSKTIDETPVLSKDNIPIEETNAPIASEPISREDQSNLGQRPTFAVVAAPVKITTTTTSTSTIATTITSTSTSTGVSEISKLSTIIGSNSIADPFPTLSSKTTSSSPPRRKTQNHQVINHERTNTAKEQKEKHPSLGSKVPTVGAHKPPQSGEQHQKANGDAVVVDKLEPDQETSNQHKLPDSKAKQKSKQRKIPRDLNRRGAEKEGTDMDAFVNPVPQAKQQSDVTESIRADSQETSINEKDKDNQESTTDKQGSFLPEEKIEKLEEEIVVVEPSKDETSDQVQSTITDRPDEPSLEQVPVEIQQNAINLTDPFPRVPIKSTKDVVDHAVVRVGEDLGTIEAPVNEIPKESPILVESNQEEQQPSTVAATTVVDEQESNKDVRLEEDVPEPSDSCKKSVPTLRYTYKKDQWSPINQTGRKCYDREFLMLLQDDPQSKVKPTLSPDLEDALKSTKSRSMMSMRSHKDVGMVCPGGLPFPSFMRSAESMSNPRMVMKRPRISMSLVTDVKLKTSENAWKPSRIKDDSTVEEDLKTDLLFKKVRSVLNKLTPQKFDKLVDQVRQLNIDTSDRLMGVINLVFEKAVDEPSFSVAYALMCKELGLISANEANSNSGKVDNTNFKKLIIARCQLEFEKNPDDEIERTRMLQEIKDCTDPDKRKELQSALEEEERRLRIKSVGNIRFIGELYKQNILTTKIMHRCINHLLSQKDEDNLECLCKLLSTIGCQIEDKSSRAEMAEYFGKMAEVISKKNEHQISSRIRFMLQDVIDLRSNGWKPRRGEVNPKTIDEIKKEAESERLESQFNASMSTPRRDDRNMDKKRNRGGGYPEDGWSLASGRTARPTYSVETAKLKNKPPEMDVLTLGNRSTYMWPSSASGMNRFTCLDINPIDQDTRAPLQLSGSRSTGPRDYGRSSDYKHPYDGRNSHNGGSSKMPTGSSSSNRENSLLGNSRNPSVSTPPQPFSKSASLTMPKTVKPPSMSSEEFFNQSLNPIFGSYLLGADIQGIILHVKQSFESPVMSKFVREVTSRSLEKMTKDRALISKLFSRLISSKILSLQDFNDGFMQILECVNDLIIDIPKIWTYLAEILVWILGDDAVQFSDLGPCWTMLKPQGSVGKLLGELLGKLAREKGEPWTVDKWEKSNLKWDNILDLELEKVQDIISEHKIQFLTGDRNSAKPPTENQLSFQEIHDQLLDHMKKDGFDICGWITTVVGDRSKESLFVRHLMRAIMKTCLVTINDKWIFDKDRFDKLKLLIPRFTDTDETLELQCLYAIQTYMNEIQHPPAILSNLMMEVYQDSLISVEALLNWRDNPNECDGWGVAIKSLGTFFNHVETDKGDSSTDEEASSSVPPNC